MKKQKKLILLAVICICILATGALLMPKLLQSNLDYWYATMCEITDNFGVRYVGSENAERTLDYLRGKFKGFGYSYQKGTLYECQTQVNDVTGASLIAVKKAKNPNPQIVTICAHYDSVSIGARDNASGLAAMLTLCKRFSTMPAYPDTELRFIAFTAEESGRQGSQAYCATLTQDEIDRSLAVFNIDILAVDFWEPTLAFSMDTMGLRTADGYVTASADAPAYNRPAKAMLAAREKLEILPDDQQEVTWCLPRHFGASDHQSFHEYGIDSVNACFRGTTASGRAWPYYMHSPFDTVDDTFDVSRTSEAMELLFTAADGLARNHSYGN